MPVANETRPAEEEGSQFPEYGPIEAALGYVLFYVLVDRLTPALVTVFSDSVLGLSPSFVRFGLATALWFVFLLTAVDQTRRQLAAIGVFTYDTYQLRVWSRVTPSSLRTAGYLVALVSGTAVASVTFPRAVEALRTVLLVIATVDPAAADVTEVFVILVFFIAYSIASHSLDVLVIDAVRALPSE